MLDLEQEQIITLGEAARLLPTRPHIATVHRWASRGVGGVKLESARIGAKIVTSKEALGRFMNRCSGGQVVVSENLKRRGERAHKELKAMGV